MGLASSQLQSLPKSNDRQMFVSWGVDRATSSDSLGTLVTDCGPLRPHQAVDWLLWIIDRVERLHSSGKCHGGISPFAVLTDEASPGVQAAFEAAGDHNSPHGFQSPERLVLCTPSQIDDIWALGASLYFLLAGELPFSGLTSAEVRRATQTTASLQLGAIHDEQLGRLVNCLLSVSLAERVVSLQVLRKVLERWQERSPSLAPVAELDDDDVQTLEMFVEPAKLAAAAAVGDRLAEQRAAMESDLGLPVEKALPDSEPASASAFRLVGPVEESEEDYVELTTGDFLELTPEDLEPHDLLPQDREPEKPMPDEQKPERLGSEAQLAIALSQPGFDIGAALDEALEQSRDVSEQSSESPPFVVPPLATPPCAGVRVGALPAVTMQGGAPARLTHQLALPRESVLRSVAPLLVVVLSAMAIITVWVL